MSVFDTREYKVFLKSWVTSQPQKGRGLLSRMAEETALSPAMISQIFNGDKHLSPEAANDVARFVGLNDDETEYFLLLVNLARAGTASLRDRLERKARAEQKKATETGKKMRPTHELPEIVNALFYSHWLYTGVLLLASGPQFGGVDSISHHLHIPRLQIQRIVDFLLQHGLCELKKGRL